MSKKGAINLSINMIIVLVIAIIVLGFALSFITGMFRDVEVSLQGQFPEPEITVSQSNPIGIGSEFQIRNQETRKISLRILNTQGTSLDTSTASITCPSGNPPSVNAIETTTIDAGDTGTVKAVIVGGVNMNPNDICTIAFDNGLNQSFFLNTN